MKLEFRIEMRKAAFTISGLLLASTSMHAVASQYDRKLMRQYPELWKQYDFWQDLRRFKTYEEAEAHARSVLEQQRPMWHLWTKGYVPDVQDRMESYELNPNVPIWREMWVENTRTMLYNTLLVPVVVCDIVGALVDCFRHIHAIDHLENLYPDHKILVGNNVVEVSDETTIPGLFMPSRSDWNRGKYTTGTRLLTLREPKIIARFNAEQLEALARGEMPRKV